MIRKPDTTMRQSIWRADAWAAARAENLGHWHTPDPKYPVASRVVVSAFLLGALTNGVTIFAITLGILILVTDGANSIRRVLMYWSIRRYGAWQEMAPDMRAVIEAPSDLAEGPARFAPMPRGFTSTANAPAPEQRQEKSTFAYPVIFLALGILIAMMVD